MKKIKKWRELTIGDRLYYFQISKSKLIQMFSEIGDFEEISLGTVSTDDVIDRYDLYKIELKEFGEMIFSEYDLDRNSDVAFNNGNDDILVMATSEEGIKNELKKLLEI